MQRQPITSSKILSMGYDPAVACLEVEYKWKSVIRYFDITPELFAESLKNRT